MNIGQSVVAVTPYVNNRTLHCRTIRCTRRIRALRVVLGEFCVQLHDFVAAFHSEPYVSSEKLEPRGESFCYFECIINDANYFVC